MDNEVAKIFYRLTHREFKRHFFYRNFINLDDFNDVFQSAMEKFAIKLQEGKYLFEYNRVAFFTLRKIFRTKMIDSFRKGKTLQKNKTRYSKGRDDDLFEITPFDYKEPDIKILFDYVDNRIDSDPELMSQKQLEFYEAFKAALLTLNESEEIQRTIMEQMGISKGYFGKLKTEVIHIFKQIIDSNE